MGWLEGTENKNIGVLSPQSFLIRMYSCLPSRSTFKTLFRARTRSSKSTKAKGISQKGSP